jgi:hypothetical protein
VTADIHSLEVQRLIREVQSLRDEVAALRREVREMRPHVSKWVADDLAYVFSGVKKYLKEN